MDFKLATLIILVLCTGLIYWAGADHRDTKRRQKSQKKLVDSVRKGK